MQTAHEIEKKQSELDLVEKQIKTQRTIRNFFMAGFVIVTMLAFITFRQYKMKNLTTHKLEETLQHLKATQEQLVYTEKMSSLGTLSAGIAHEIQNPLNFVNNFSDLSAGLIDDFNSTSSEEEKKAILNDLKGNLGKINEHGKRADSIVKSMLEHTHIGSREKRPTSINNLANEFFTLAYHSFRAKEPGFTCLIEKQFDKNLPLVNINPQDISRVMINLFNNALYSLNKKRFIGNADFYPSITIESKMADGKIYFSVKDNGTGIPDELLDKIFEPFFTSKPAGEGTGLGLSISHEIVTQGHGGTLEVKNTEGLGAEFIITLPV
jgi:signal transduction histidine kinase